MSAPTVDDDLLVAVDVDVLPPSDWEDLRTGRLAALKDSPHAFAATLGQERRRRNGDWIDLAKDLTWTVARECGQVVGIASMTPVDESLPKVRFIESVWVARGLRKRGLVRQMLAELELRARDNGADRLQLWVLETNDQARGAWVQLGFVEPEPAVIANSPKLLPGGTGFVKERLMVKQLD
jgi:ribosomal protein S18 acetylase RimI-like enzyme